MDLNDVQQFAEVARLGSYSHAARSLGVARSTLSRVVQRLEAELGTTLLHRTTRRVELTGPGAAFLERITPALDDLHRAVEDLQAQRDEPAGLLRVSTTSDVGVSVLAPVVSELVAAYPRLRVDVMLTLRPVDLVGEKVDAALRTYADRPTHPELVGTRLGSLTFGWYASPAYLARTPWAGTGLDDHPIAAPTGLHPTARASFDDSLFGLALVKSGGGVGLLPDPLCVAEVEAGSLIRLLPEVSVFTGQLWLVYPEGARSPRLDAFRDAVRRHVGDGGPLVQAP